MIGDLTSGSSFEASAHPFAEFSLCKAGEEILRLRYAHDAEVESKGGTAYQAQYSGQRWTVQFFRTPFLQRESYRVICNDTVVATTDLFRPLRTASINYADGTIWRCHVKVWSSEVDDSRGVCMLHTLPKVGLIMGRSSLHIDHELEEERGVPLLVIMTHFTTHSDS